MYHQEAPKPKRPTLRLDVTIKIDGMMLSAPIPKDLECKVMVAMRNSEEKKCLTEGMLQVWFPCMRNTTPTEKATKIEAFCRWLTRRSDILVLANV
jgi:hypothetical protein